MPRTRGTPSARRRAATATAALGDPPSAAAPRPAGGRRRRAAPLTRCSDPGRRDRHAVGAATSREATAVFTNPHSQGSPSAIIHTGSYERPGQATETTYRARGFIG